MKITLLALAVILLAACTFAQSSHDSSTENTSKTSAVSSSASPTEAPKVTSTIPPSSKETTTSSTSSEPTTTSSSTSAPTTTSSSAPTTTSSTSSEPTTTSSTSSEPTTTSTSTTPETTSVTPTSSTEPPITSTPTPITSTPVPVPKPGYWNVTNGNTTCIRAKLAIRFKMELVSGVEYIEVSPDVSSGGSSCNISDGTELLELRDIEYKVRFYFEKKSDSVYVKNTTFTYYLPKDIGEFSNDTHFFEVKSGSSYLCKTQTDVVLGNVTMEVFYIQVQAFGTENNKDFGSAEECGADHPINDIVPIAVGVALLALVVVVLIAYLVGRRRSRQKGYQSV